MRSRGSERWSQIETARGQYSSTFAGLDAWTAAAAQHHARLLWVSTETPSWASNGPTQPPRDLNYTNETCQAPLAGQTRATGDCIWAEFVTKFMQHVCGVGSQPSHPLVGACKVRVFESWNEFNDGQYWTSNYTDMAKMANDAAGIIKRYCGDCTVLAGNTSAGGDGYNPNYYHNPAVAPRFDQALGQMLDAWHAIPHATLPDGVSYHAYNARRSVIPYPMPETNVSHGSSMCTASNVPNPNCDIPLIHQVSSIHAVLQQRSWAAHLPVWNTEGGYGRNDDLTDGSSESDANSIMLKQAYVSRWLLIMGSSGTATNLWYQYDDPCWGTMMGYGIAPSKTGCPTNAEIPAGYTPNHQAWVQTTSWLNGVSFDGPCTNQGAIWRCYITEPSGARGLFLWTTDWLASTSVGVGSTFHQWRDLDGNTYQLNSRTSVPVTNRPILVE